MISASSSYGGNPMACAAALAATEVIQQENLLQQAGSAKSEWKTEEGYLQLHRELGIPLWQTATLYLSGGFGFIYMLHLVSAIPNAGPYIEFKGYTKLPIDGYRTWKFCPNSACNVAFEKSTAIPAISTTK